MGTTTASRVVDRTELGGRLQALRFRDHLTTRDVEAATGIPNTTVARWERAAGKEYPETARLARLADLYGVSVSELLDPDTPSRVWMKHVAEVLSA